MKKVFCLSVLVTITLIGKTQASGKYIGSTGVGTNFSIQNNDGKLIPIGTKEDPKGTPYLLDSWSNVTVYLTNGAHYSDSLFNYSLFDEQLYFNKNNNLFAVTDEIKEFILTPSARDNDQTTYRFANGYPVVNNTNEKTFYQILAKGTHYHLLKWQHKKIRETYVYGSNAEFDYVNQINYFIYNAASNKMIFAGNKANAANIKNTLSIEESIWKAYLNNHSANIKNEEAMIDFVNYLNN